MSISIRQMLVASKNYKIKCPYPLVPEGICVHNTYNDASANNEVQYMIVNQNQVSFHWAVDDKEVVQGLPLDRNAWAAGDGNGPGNRKYLHLEICYSKSGGERYRLAEENAVQFIAEELKRRGWGIERVKKHEDFSRKHCPHRILDEKRWSSFLGRIEAAMRKNERKVEEVPKFTKKVVIPNTAFWQTKNLIHSYMDRGYKCYGEPQSGYEASYPKETDPWPFVIETNPGYANQLINEFKKLGYDSVFIEAM